MASEVTERSLSGGLPCLTVGKGPTVLVIPGLTPDNELPTGLDRRFTLQMTGQLASHFTTHWVNRRPGLEAGTMIADMASDYAAAIEADLDGPLDVVGTSTGGPIAIQLALDYPNLVKRLVLISTASGSPSTARGPSAG